MWTRKIVPKLMFVLDADTVGRYLPDNRVGITAHFLLHGIHHYLPMDKLRLVMPPTLFIVLATPFWKLAHTLFYWDWYIATDVFCGGIFGYICYDLTHYFLHHKKYVSYLAHKSHLLNFAIASPPITASSKNTTYNTIMQTMRMGLESPVGSGTRSLAPNWLRSSLQRPQKLHNETLCYACTNNISMVLGVCVWW